VGEVFFKLMKEDPDSILGQGVGVVPPAIADRIPRANTFGAAPDGRFALADLVRYAHDIPLAPTAQANFGVR